MKKPKKFKFFIPEGSFPVLKALAETNPTLKDKNKLLYKYIYVLSAVIFQSGMYKRGSATINMIELCGIIGTNPKGAAIIVDDLVSVGLLIRTQGYVPGVKSFTYQVPCDAIDIVEAAGPGLRIAEKIITKHNEKMNDNNQVKEYLEVVKKLSVDKEYVNHVWNTETKESSIPSPLQQPYDVRISEKCFKIVHLGNLAFLPLLGIVEQEYYALRPDVEKKSRVYTNVTNLKRELRQYLRLNGKPITEVDTANSQPLLATILIKEWWDENMKTPYPQDILDYQKMCENGKFYNYFMDLNDIAQTEEARGKFKVKFFGEIFFSEVTTYMTKLKGQFINVYPNVYNAICAIKGGVGSKTYNEFALRLQKKEAQIIFDGVNMRLIREGINALNVFDSIVVTTTREAKLAKKYIREEYEKYGLKPTIKEK